MLCVLYPIPWNAFGGCVALAGCPCCPLLPLCFVRPLCTNKHVATERERERRDCDETKSTSLSSAFFSRSAVCVCDGLLLGGGGRLSLSLSLALLALMSITGSLNGITAWCSSSFSSSVSLLYFYIHRRTGAGEHTCYPMPLSPLAASHIWLWHTLFYVSSLPPSSTTQPSHPSP